MSEYGELHSGFDTLQTVDTFKLGEAKLEQLNFPLPLMRIDCNITCGITLETILKIWVLFTK